ncbi:MAG: hypothetical protein AAF962_06160 [Actinomycetota bacterium]
MAVDRGSASPLVVAAAFTVDARSGRSGLQIAVLGRGAPMAISELEGGLPGQGLELRTSGLWVEMVCEQPFRHWSYGLEAFALALDDPAELLGRGLGLRVPLGWELEFESDDEPQWLGPPFEGDVRPAFGAYRQLGVAHGLLLTDDGETPVEGRAVRSHTWGGTTLPPETVLAVPGIETGAVTIVGGADGGEPGSEVALPGLESVWWVRATAAGAETRTEDATPRL